MKTTLKAVNTVLNQRLGLLMVAIGLTLGIAQGQSEEIPKLVEGTVYLVNGQVQEGFLALGQPNAGSQILYFRKDEGSPIQQFRQTEIVFFELGPNKLRHEWVIRRPWHTLSDTSGIFMEVLAKSTTYALFQEVYQGREFFYVKKGDRMEPLQGGRVTQEGEILYERGVNSRLNTKYTFQLKFLLPENEAMQKKIANTEYKRGDLIELFELVARQTGEEFWLYTPPNQEPDYRTVQVYAKAGYGRLSTTHLVPTAFSDSRPVDFGTFPNFRYGAVVRKELGLSNQYAIELSGMFYSRPERTIAASEIDQRWNGDIILNGTNVLEMNATAYYRIWDQFLPVHVFVSGGIGRNFTKEVANFTESFSTIFTIRYASINQTFTTLKGGLSVTFLKDTAFPIHCGGFYGISFFDGTGSFARPIPGVNFPFHDLGVGGFLSVPLYPVRKLK